MQDLGADARGNKSEPVTPVSQGPGPYFCPQTMSSKTGEVHSSQVFTFRETVLAIQVPLTMEAAGHH